MRRHLLVAIALLSFLNLDAAHLWGGDISWECVGTNQFQFQLRLYRDCQGSTIAPGPQDIVGPFGTISCAFVSKNEVLNACYDPMGSYDCNGSPVITGPVEQYIYQSSSITLTGTPPATGWEFYYTDCCRSYLQNSSTSITHLSSKMYSGAAANCANSPEFVGIDPIYSPGAKFLNNMAYEGNIGDSLYYRLADPLMMSNGAITFGAGYDAAAPFPDTSESALNGPITMDHTTGTIGLDIHSSSLSGAERFVYAVEVESWTSGALYSSVRREMVLTTYDSATITPNLPPVLAADTSKLINRSTDPLWVNSNKIKVEVMPGDTVDLDLMASDFEFNNGPVGTLPQQIRFTRSGFALSTARTGFSVSPSVLPISPQAGYVSTMNNSINFNWPIGLEHMHGDRVSYTFSLRFTDDACPGGKSSWISLEVVVVEPDLIAADTMEVCTGDSTQLMGSIASGNYLWSPNLEISDVNAASPWVNPSASRYYYLSDPTDSMFVDSVFVKLVQPQIFRLDTSASLMTLVDSVQMGQPIWYHNGVPFVNPYDTLQPFGPGQYWVELVTPNCKYRTDTVLFSSSNLSMYDPNNGSAATDPLNLTGSWSVVFDLNAMASGDLNEIVIPGIIDLSGKTGGYDLKAEIIDGGGQVLFRLDTNVASLNGELLSLPAQGSGFSFQSGNVYQLSITGDTGYAFSYYTNVQLPSTPWNNGITITALDIDGAATNTMLPVVFNITHPIGVGEEELRSIAVYPNPASETIYIRGLNQDEEIRILDITGRCLKVLTMKESGEVDVRFLEAGVYLLHLQESVFKLQIR